MIRYKSRRNSGQKKTARRRLEVEHLESRQMLTTAFSLPDLVHSSVDSTVRGERGGFVSGLLDNGFSDRAGVSEGRPDVRPAQGQRFDRWYSQLSPVVQHSIEHARDLSQWTGAELATIPTWAVVTEDRVTALDLFRKIRPKSVQPRTELFGDQIRVHVWEVEFDADMSPEQLLVNVQGEAGRGILDILPLSGERNEVNGTLDPAAVTDPFFPAQWHLDATASNVQWGIDAEGAWASSTGEGVTVAIVDTRQQFNHPDLLGNNNAALNYDDANRDWDGDGIGDNNPNIFLPGGSPNWPGINDADLDFDGILETDQLRQQSHGTAVAGIVLGDDEGTRMVGVAPDATYAAFNFLENPAQSMANTFSNANIAPIDVFNNSWGAGDIRQLRYRTFLDLQAVQNAATTGVFVKAAGNNRDVAPGFNGWDRANYDQLHMRQTIVVAATQQRGRVEWYSNPGSNVLVSAPVNQTGGGNTLTADVTDTLASPVDNRGYSNGDITTGFNGTSAAAPMVSGVAALMLEVNPTLDWRNTQHILIDTAQKNGLIDFDGDGILDGGDGNSDGLIDNVNLRNGFAANANYDTDLDGALDPYHTGWFQNGAGNWVSDDFGFGMVDAQAAVQAAAAWTPVQPELSVKSLTRTVTAGALAEGNLAGLASVNNVDTFVTESNLTVEWVEVTVNATVADQADLMLVLQSPSGSQSVLMAPGGTSTQADINSFTFNTNQFWDENAAGGWTLQALDTGVADGQATTINDWQISIYGVCDAESPLIVTSMAHPFATLENFAGLALSAGGLQQESYVLNHVNQVGDSLSMGVFSQGTDSGLPVDQGLLFTSGKVVDAIGPNERENTTTQWSNSGHPLLDEVAGRETFDASGLEIYFTPTKDVALSYEFLFGSEEFEEFVGSPFNDSAGIFITALKSPSDGYENGFKPVNVAKAFNGADLAVNELATKNPSGSVSGKYYDANPCCGDMNWEYDGSSLLSQSKSVELLAGMHYYIGIMVADASDGLYDSAMAIGLDGSGVKTAELFSIAKTRITFDIEAVPMPLPFKPGASVGQRMLPMNTLRQTNDALQQKENARERIPFTPFKQTSRELARRNDRTGDRFDRPESLAAVHVDSLLKEFESVEDWGRFSGREGRAK